MYAIVKTGGKQYKVAVGDKLNIEKLDAEVGATVVSYITSGGETVMTHVPVLEEKLHYLEGLAPKE